MMRFRFGTAIKQLYRWRTQELVIDHIEQNYNTGGVDMVTFPGAAVYLVKVDYKQADAHFESYKAKLFLVVS